MKTLYNDLSILLGEDVDEQLGGNSPGGAPYIQVVRNLHNSLYESFEEGLYGYIFTQILRPLTESAIDVTLEPQPMKWSA